MRQRKDDLRMRIQQYFSLKIHYPFKYLMRIISEFNVVKQLELFSNLLILWYFT